MRVGRIESVVPDRNVLLDRLDAAQSLDEVKSVVADMIVTIGKYVYGYNERTDEHVLGVLSLSGGGGVLFSNVDETGRVITHTSVEQILPQPDRKSDPVIRRQEAARAQRVTVGKKE